MKKHSLHLIAVAICIAGLAAACSSTGPQTKKGTPSSEKSGKAEKIIRTLWTWGSSIEDEPESFYEKNRTYIRGLRWMYGHFNPSMGIQTMQSLSPVPIFVSGPHVKDGKPEINLGSNTFGHYNKAFFTWAQDHLIPGAKDKAFRVLTQSIYNEYLGDIARVYYDAYFFMKNQESSEIEKIKTQYLNEINRLKNAPDNKGQFEGPGDKIYMLFNYEYVHQTDQFHSPDYIEYNEFVAPGFWIRRNIDGTQEEAFNLLKKLIHTYDEDFEYDMKEYYKG